MSHLVNPQRRRLTTISLALINSAESLQSAMARNVSSNNALNGLDQFSIDPSARRPFGDGTKRERLSNFVTKILTGVKEEDMSHLP